MTRKQQQWLTLLAAVSIVVFAIAIVYYCTRDPFDERLVRLPRIWGGKNIEGAMCYSISIAPDRCEYICPVCGSRTFWPEEYEQRIKSLKGDACHREFCATCRRPPVSINTLKTSELEGERPREPQP